MKIDLPEDYKPSDDEVYMNSLQLTYFKHKLIQMRNKIELKLNSVASNLKEADEEVGSGEILVSSVNWDRKKKDIDLALDKIENGNYGYCDNTGEEIGIHRLEIEPTAKYCIEEQSKIERHGAFLKEGNRGYDED